MNAPRPIPAELRRLVNVTAHRAALDFEASQRAELLALAERLRTEGRTVAEIADAVRAYPLACAEGEQ